LYHQCDKSLFIKTNKSQGASPEKVALIGCRVAIYTEGETSDEIEFNALSVKEITGEDEIYGRGLFKAPINFRAQCKLGMLTNYPPNLDGQFAVVQRLRMLFFDSSFTKKPKGKNEFKINPEFVEKIMTLYLSEIFSWIAKGSYQYYQSKTIIMPPSIQERCTKLILQEDSIESFIEKRLKVTNNKKDFIRKGTLFDLYRLFSNANSQRCKPRSTFFNRLADLKIMESTLDGYDVFRGITVTEEKKDVEEYKFNDKKEECDNTRVRALYNIKHAKRSKDESESETETESESEEEEIVKKSKPDTPIKKKGFGKIPKNKDCQLFTITQKQDDDSESDAQDSEEIVKKPIKRKSQ
jgi:phage/plasmid-associated DNA primase